jgi:hypothetical protein
VPDADSIADLIAAGWLIEFGRATAVI